jgi:vacuolar-type H+-ATPase subunit I/STV1
MTDSLQGISPEEIKEFFKHICFVVRNQKEREEARREMHKQIMKIKTAPKKWILDKEIGKLHKTVENVVDAETKLPKYKDNAVLLRHLSDKVRFLETQLAKVRKEKEEAVLENRRKIEEIKASVEQIRARMFDVIKAKEERDRRIRELEKKAKKIV